MAKHRASSSRRGMGSLVRRTTNQYWVDSLPAATGPLTVVVGTPLALPMLTNLGTDYQAQSKGATIMTIKGSITAIQIAPGGATPVGTLTAGFVVEGATIPAADLDPSTANGRQRSWMWQSDWYWNYGSTALATNTSVQVQESRREISVSSKRIIDANDDTLFLVLGASGIGSTASWAVKYHVRTLIRIP